MGRHKRTDASQGNTVEQYTTPLVLPQHAARLERVFWAGTVLSEDGVGRFLQQMRLPKLDPESRDALELPITVEEVGEAVTAMAKSKSPGSDGFPVELYQAFSSTLRKRLL
ncbi:hypothetical protein NDU88_005741 [Pleurodeles waltl]|uniref:Uncharacterized protein n=1 Tax=Pleurodeles waltl TaxID=8319 RepID=A0AAV7RPV3_PLEWA|nr:hypothetical protein NDU88_005741 [Pleurodeles waltl]